MSDRNLNIALIVSATDRASAVLGRVYANAERRAGQMEKLGRSMNDMGNKGLVAGAALAAPLVGAVKSAADFEKLGMSLNILAGSAEKGAILFEKLKKFAADTPFELNEIIRAQKTMMGFGISTNDALVNLRNIGDVAAITGGNMEGIVLAFSQAAATGKLMGQDLNQLINNGVPIIDMLAKSMGVATSKVKAMSSAGLITYPVMQKAFADATKAGGKFAGGMDQLSNTTSGRFAKMSDNIQFLAVKIGDALLPSVNKLLDRIFPLMERFNAFAATHPKLINNLAKGTLALIAFSGSMKVLGFAFSGVSTLFSAVGNIAKFTRAIREGGSVAMMAKKGYDGLKFGIFALQYGMKFTIIPALKAAGTAIINFGATLLASPITWYVLAAVALGAAVYLIIKNWDKISAFFARLWAGVKVVFIKFWDWAKYMFFNYTPHGLIIKHWAPISGMFARIWNNVKGVFNGVWNWFVGLNVKFGQAGINIVMSIWRGMKTVITKPVEVMAEMAKKMREYLPFSPAKVGPLKDIHRIKLVETIAQSINAKPLLAAMHNITGEIFAQSPRIVPYFGGQTTGNTQITFSPTVNLYGGATEADAKKVTDSMKAEFTKLLRDHEQQKSRRGFN